MSLKHTLIFSLLSLSHSYAQLEISMVGVLPGDVSETSGLIFFNNSLITHNDSGNSAQLFEIDTLTLTVKRTVTISNATNVDWEDIAQDENYIYIADIGNFTGNRTDLVIYRVAKIDYLSSDTVAAERINFSYEDQSDFTSTTESDWDAEALVSVGDHLLIFTKEWERQGTTAYYLPKLPGTNVAVRMAFFDSAGLITGAEFQPDPAWLLLIGYSRQLQPFLLQIRISATDFGLSSEFEKISLGTISAQTEGITHVHSNRYFISAEYFSNPSPAVVLESALYSFSLTTAPGDGDPPPIEEPPGEEEPPVGSERPDLRLFREFNSSELHYELNLPNEVFGRAIFDASGRLVRYTHATDLDTNTINIEGLGSAIYYLTFYLNGQTISRPFHAN